MNSLSKRTCYYLVIISLILTVMLNLIAPGFTKGRDEWQEPDRVMEELNLKPGTHVADIGCGKGYFTFRIANAVGDEGKVFAVDINKKALTKLQKKAKKKNLNNIVIIHSESTNTKLPHECADVAMLCLVLHHVPEDQRQPLMHSIFKALKPGGYLFILDFRKVHNPPHHSYDELVSREEVIKFANTAGLILDAEWYYLKHQYFLRFKKSIGESTGSRL